MGLCTKALGVTGNIMEKEPSRGRTHVLIPVTSLLEKGMVTGVVLFLVEKFMRETGKMI